MMNASTVTIIKEAIADGVHVSLTPAGKLKISGSDEAVKKWLPVLQEKKDELTASLHDELPAWKWLVTFPDGREILSHNVPFATRQEVMESYPEAAHVEQASIH